MKFASILQFRYYLIIRKYFNLLPKYIVKKNYYCFKQLFREIYNLISSNK